jgi:hypothetical protein
MIGSTHVKTRRSASGGKGGEQNQAVGRSRGRRNTKIHAIGDAKGRILTIMLTGGEAHDCPSGTELILQTKPSDTLLGDKAYDSAELRASLKEHGNACDHPEQVQSEAQVQIQQKALPRTASH